MQKIAKYITEGSEGFFLAQYGTIFKLSIIFCVGIMLIYFMRSPPTKQSNNNTTNNNNNSNSTEEQANFDE